MAHVEVDEKVQMDLYFLRRLLKKEGKIIKKRVTNNDVVRFLLNFYKKHKEAAK